jgi:hypothetical protein
MVQTVQLSLTDGSYLASVREALGHTCAWRIISAAVPDATQPCVQVLDDLALARLPLPLSHPERVVLVTSRKDPQWLAEAWEAGIVSVVSPQDPMNTVLLAIMAAGLRVASSRTAAHSSAISPNVDFASAPIDPSGRTSFNKRCKLQ